MASFSLSCSHCGAANDPGMERCHQCGHPLFGVIPGENVPQPKLSRRAMLWGATIGSIGVVLLSTGGYLTYRWLTNPHILTYAGKDGALDATWSSDSKRIASVCGDGNTVQIWYATTGEKLVTCTLEHSVHGGPPYLPAYWFDAGGKRVAWSVDGKSVLALVGPSEKPMVQVWNAVNGQRVRSFPITPSLTLGEEQDGGIPIVNSWALNARYLAVTRLLLETGKPFGTKSFLDIWDIAAGSLVLTVDTTRPETSRGYRVSTMVWAPDGKKLALGYSSKGEWFIEIWDVLSGRRTPVLGRGVTLGTLAWSPHGTFLAVATPLGTMIYDAETGNQVRAYPFVRTRYSFAWSPEGTRVATTSYTGGHYWVPTSGVLSVFDTSHGSPLDQYDQGQWDLAMLGMGRIAWSPNGQFLFVLNGDINIWKMA